MIVLEWARINTQEKMNATKTNFLHFLQSRGFSIVLFAYVLISVIAATQGLLGGVKTYIPGDMLI